MRGRKEGGGFKKIEGKQASRFLSQLNVQGELEENCREAAQVEVHLIPLSPLLLQHLMIPWLYKLRRAD